MKGWCGRCSHWRGLMFLGPNQPGTIFLDLALVGPDPGAMGLFHAYETTSAHLCHSTATFPLCLLLFLLFLLPDISLSPSTSMFHVQHACQHSCPSCLKGGHGHDNLSRGMSAHGCVTNIMLSTSPQERRAASRE